MKEPDTTAGTSRWRKLTSHFSDSFAEEFAYQRGDIGTELIDPQALKRGRDAYRYILLLLVLILIPLTIHNLYAGEIVPTIGSLSLLIMLIANVWLLSSGHSAFLSPTLLLVLSIALVFLSLYQGRAYSMYWLYPLLIGLPVLLRARWALVLGVLCGLALAPMLYQQFERTTAIVISFSMVTTWLVSAWLVFAVNEQANRLKSMTITDPLTGAYNRRFLEVRAQQTLDAWRRYQHPAAMLLIDIDHFKVINDRYGHSLGDIALKRLVKVVSTRLRSVDTVSRFGGEEFVILLSEISIDEAARVAQELRALIEAAGIIPEGTMTISIGVCDVTIADDLDHWFRLADTALYLAKKNGRNRVEIALAVTEMVQPRENPLPQWR